MFDLKPDQAIGFRSLSGAGFKMLTYKLLGGERCVCFNRGTLREDAQAIRNDGTGMA